MPKVPRAKQKQRHTRGHQKRTGEARPQTIRRVEARIERWQATLADMKAEQAAGATPGRGAAQPEQSPRTGAAEVAEYDPSDSEKRVVIKFFYGMLGRPAEEEWGRRDGVISIIRRRMGTSAPSVQNAAHVGVHPDKREDCGGHLSV